MRVRLFRVFLLCALALCALPLFALAQSSGLPTPTVTDYSSGATSFLTSIAPVISGLMPFAAAALALMFAPRLLKKIVKMFAS